MVKNLSLEGAINSSIIFAEWSKTQLKNKKPNKFNEKYFESDLNRLNESIKKANQERTYNNATSLTNLAAGLMKIYQDSPISSQ